MGVILRNKELNSYDHFGQQTGNDMSAADSVTEVIDYVVTDPDPCAVTSFTSPALVHGVTRCQNLGTPMGALELGAVTPARQDTIDPENKDAAEDQHAGT